MIQLKTKRFFFQLTNFLFIAFLLIGNIEQSDAKDIVNDSIKFQKFKGKIIDSKTKKALIFATVSVNGTNISTVSNTQGNFSLKVPIQYVNNDVTFSFLGYTSKVLSLSTLNKKENIVRLETHIEELAEVNIVIKDPQALVKEVLRRKRDNYLSDPANMTAFYRETIKKRRTYVSLSEAVVEIGKQAYTSGRSDVLNLYRARKSTDYTKLDTVALKLRGGPFSTIYLDIVKNPTLFLTDDLGENYEFHFDTSTKIDNRVVYVVSFKQKSHINDPLFYGKLFIDSQNLALSKAEFKLNLKNKLEASRMFILKKPARAKVHPVQANYVVNYREKDGKWFYGYSRIELGFKVDWDKRLFNTIYYTTIEMAITDWKKADVERFAKTKDRLRSSMILSDEVSGFNDPEFWGEFNVIEPEKPIESAIKKIQKQLRKVTGK